MDRDIYLKLVEWKSSPYRKPLILRGARQTGKTFLLKQFGQKEYSKVFYYNFERMREIKDFFIRNLNPLQIIESLSRYSKSKIDAAHDLIIFDEIQACDGALSSLKYFQEEHPEYHIAAAGSLLGIKLSVPGTFPVGKVNFLEIHPMTFAEFLTASGEVGLRERIEKTETLEPFEKPFHDALVGLLRRYYFVGGMPEAVKTYVETNEFFRVQAVHEDILDAYELDFAKHAPVSDIPKLSEVWKSIPLHLARENKKFIFSAIRESARARDFSAALQWLVDAGLVHKACAISHVETPLSGFANRDIFKIYCLDTGLLASMAHIEASMVTDSSDLFQTYHGAFVENYVAQQLSALKNNHELAYWKSEGKLAEVDFLHQYKGAIYPLEVKAGINPHSKSLLSYRSHYAPILLLRSTLLNLKLNGVILNIPLYALHSLDRYVDLALASGPAVPVNE